METTEFIEALRNDGELLADLAGRTGWEAAVPTCPEWRMRDLVGHLGNVHRWATGYVAGATRPVRMADRRPADEDLAAWFRDGHRTLVDELSGAPADRECWTFMAAPSPIVFWARRQAHETAVHRMDAESAVAPADHTPVGTDFALDGIDELLTGFHTNPRSKVRTLLPRTLLVQATDAPGAGRGWLMRLSQDIPGVERVTDGWDGPADADCTISGPAAVLYRALWNRSGYEGLKVTGDTALADLWRRSSGI